MSTRSVEVIRLMTNGLKAANDLFTVYQCAPQPYHRIPLEECISPFYCIAPTPADYLDGAPR